jgi:hypothetical protein
VLSKKRQKAAKSIRRLRLQAGPEQASVYADINRKQKGLNRSVIARKQRQHF